MSRRRFTERQVIETLIRCGVEVKCYRTKEPITVENVGQLEREHILELRLGGADEPVNCAYSLKAAHHIITNGTKATTAGSSKHRIAKVDRLIEGPQPSDRPMGKTRGFQKPPPGYKHKWWKRTMGRRT